MFVSSLLGWFVGLFVCYALFDFLKSANLILIKFGTDVQHLCHVSLLTFERSRSTFKVMSLVHDPPATAMTRPKNVNKSTQKYVKLSRSHHLSGAFGFELNQAYCFVIVRPGHGSP